VNGALLDGLVEGRNGLAEELLGSLFVALDETLAETAQCGAQARGIGPVAGGTLNGLTGALQRRIMICHLLLLPSFPRESISVGAEYVILRE
jgi:hypothetical protein